MKNSNLILTIIITTSLLSGTTILSYGATNPIPSPREQMDAGISSANVVCKAGLTLIVRANTDTGKKFFLYKSRVRAINIKIDDSNTLNVYVDRNK
ncbi:MAG: hypothetical protein OEM28_12520 [Nitrosopumilus sp.]|nr:hypothetical protein [Nitrosopumilus sp.]MDH3488392.1 hypothetical protein [Nitrosopumilus sp.]